MNKICELPSFCVMNNHDLFKEIFSFLRKDAIIKCEKCNLTIQWDNTRPKICDYVACGDKTLCFNCWFDERGWFGCNIS